MEAKATVVDKGPDGGPGGERPGGAEAGSWFSTLSADRKAELRRLNQLRPAWSLMALGFVALWAVCGAALLCWPAWPVRVLATLAIGVAIQGLGILMHEGVHGNL